MTRIIFAALALLSATTAHPEPGTTRAVASLASYHLERGRGYCEINPGIGLEHELARDVRFHAGGYEGSKCMPITYLGASWMGLELPRGVRAGAGILAFHGYEKDRSKIIWAPVPAFYVPLGARRGVNIPFMLPYKDFKGGIGLQVSFE